MNWFHELYLNPGTSFWRYLLRVSAATFVLTIPISYALFFIVPDLYPANRDLISARNLWQSVALYCLIGPILFSVLSFIITYILRPRTRNPYLIAGAIAVISSLIAVFLEGPGYALVTAWPVFACGLAYQVGYRTSALYAALSGGGVQCIYNLAAMGMYFLGN